MELKVVLLGLLKKRPRHGYEIKNIIKKELEPLTNVTLTSIYYTLKNLEKQQLVKSEKSREGRRPEKRVYRITDKGKKEAENLLLKNFLTLERPFFDIDIALYFLEELPPEKIKRHMEKRIKGLEKVLQWSCQMKTRFAEGSSRLNRMLICEHAIESVRTEIKFTKRMEGLF